MVVYLASEACEETGHVYSVAGGRVARIVTMETPGVVFDVLTPEAIGGRIGQINGRSNQDLVEPSSLDDETALIGTALAGGLTNEVSESPRPRTSSTDQAGIPRGTTAFPALASATEFTFDLAQQILSSQRESARSVTSAFTPR